MNKLVDKGQVVSSGIAKTAGKAGGLARSATFLAIGIVATTAGIAANRTGIAYYKVRLALLNRKLKKRDRVMDKLVAQMTPEQLQEIILELSNDTREEASEVKAYLESKLARK